jgi:hypothetical protein
MFTVQLPFVEAGMAEIVANIVENEDVYESVFVIVSVWADATETSAMNVVKIFFIGFISAIKYRLPHVAYNENDAAQQYDAQQNVEVFFHVSFFP